MNPGVDHYLLEGCGRCALGGTPECKVHSWEHELVQLRRIILECGLTEDVKWSVPCYTWEGNNILILSAFVDNCTISFFKGALLQDEAGILEKPGPNTQAARVIRFTDIGRINELEEVIKAYIFEAVEVEKAGLEVEFKKPNDVDMPEELANKLEEDPVFKAAFESLTPGRQRGYLLYFSQAKQSKTRISRIEKYMPIILEGKGMQD